MSQVSSAYVHHNEPGKGAYGSTLAEITKTYLKPTHKENIVRLLKSVPIDSEKSAFNLGDYGSADGASSMTFIKDLIISLKEHHGPQVQFQVIYEDQATNDFNSLFKRLSRIIPGPPSNLLELDNVFPLASGMDFRQQCVPSESMHFIMSNAAVHFLSKTPVMYKNSICIYPDGSPEEKKALDEQARVDWETFLLMRSRELKQGGILLVSCLGTITDETGADIFPDKSRILIFRDVWKSFRDIDKITGEEFLQTNTQSCAYSLEQLTAPFQDKSSPVAKSGLKLVAADQKINEDIYYTTWKRKNAEGFDDREEFVGNLLAAHWNWSQHIFLAGLSGDRSEQEKKQILKELYVELEKRMIQTHPVHFSEHFIHYITVRKE